MLSKQIENAQKKVEQQNFLIRKRVLEYDDVMNEQRRVDLQVPARDPRGPRHVGGRGRGGRQVVVRLVEEYTQGDVFEEWDLAGLQSQGESIWAAAASTSPSSTRPPDREDIRELLIDDSLRPTSAREEELGAELMRYLERMILLQIIDNRWREHLYEMDYLREGIHLRGFAQIDPLVAYKNEGYSMFQELMAAIWEEFARVIFHVEVNVEPAQAQEMFEPRRRRAASSTRAAARTQPSALADARGQAAAGGRRRRRGCAPPPEQATATAAPATRRARTATPPPARSSRTSTRSSAATIPAGAARARSTRSATALTGA